MPGNMFRQLNNNQSMAVVHGELSSRCRIEKLAFRYVPVRKEEEQRLKLHPSTVHSVMLGELNLQPEGGSEGDISFSALMAELAATVAGRSRDGRRRRIRRLRCFGRTRRTRRRALLHAPKRVPSEHSRGVEGSRARAGRRRRRLRRSPVDAREPEPSESRAFRIIFNPKIYTKTPSLDRGP